MSFLTQSLHIFYTYNSSSHLCSSGFWVACVFDEMGLDIQIGMKFLKIFFNVT